MVLNGCGVLWLGVLDSFGASMNTASLELCKELYELSGWECDGFYYSRGQLVFDYKEFMLQAASSFPAYDSGFMLRKLPPCLPENDDWRLSLEPNFKGSQWFCGYTGRGSFVHVGQADTPEDCLVKLAIELFKQNILKREA